MTKVAYAFPLAFVLVVQGASADAPDFGRAGPPMSVVATSLQQGLGAMRGSYLMPDALVSSQILQSIGIPDRTERLDDGNYLLSGCRMHSCDEKAAIIANPDGKMVASALIHFHCHVVRGGEVDCDSAPRLTLFLKSDPHRDILSQELKSWARRVATVSEIETRAIR